MRKKVFSQAVSQAVSVGLAVVTIGGFTPFATKAESRSESIVKPFQQYGASPHVSQLAQQSGTEKKVMNLPEGTIVFSQTDRIAVRVYNSNGFPRLNLYNKQTRKTEMLGAVIRVESTDAGAVYRATGKRRVAITIAKSGEQTITIDNVLQQESKAITGKVSYLPRIALSPTAVVEISLVDESQADTPAIAILSSQKIVSGGRQVPFPFTLPYDPGQIKSRSSYVVQARITVDGDLQFVSKTQFPVITSGNPTDVDVRVEPVDQAQLKNTVWKLEQILYSDGKRLKPTSPSNYTIELMDDGQLSIRADCNRALGRFTENDGLSINLGPTTLAACPPESIAQDYLRSLQNASGYFFKDGKLLIDIKADTGTMQFSR